MGKLKLGTIIFPIYTVVIAGIVAYILNYSLVEMIYTQYIGSPLAYQITLMEAPLRIDLNIVVFYSVWILTGVIVAWRSKNPLKGAVGPAIGFITALLLWVFLRSWNLGTFFIDQLNADLLFLIDRLIPGGIAVAIGGILGFVIARWRFKKSQAQVITVDDPEIEFIDKCPKCGTVNHSTAVYCAACGTEIYQGLGKQAVIVEEQKTISTLI